MSEWREFTLGEVLQPKGYIRGPFGSALRRNELLTNGIPVYEQQHAIYEIRTFRFYINDAKFQEMRRFATQKDDLIISCSGTLGKVSRIKENDANGIISQALLLLRANQKLIRPCYLQYILSSKEGYNSIISRSSGSVQVNIARREIIENIPLILPELDEQDNILKVLSSLDDKIDLLTRQNATLEALSQTYFRQWFTDCEQSTPLQEVFNLVNGFAFKSSTYKMTGNYRIITIKNVRDGEITPSGAAYVQEIPKEMSAKCKLSVGDVLISLTGNVGRVGIVTDENLLLNQRVAKFSPNENILLPYFYFMFRQSDMKTYLESIAKGTAQQNLSPVETLKTLIPFETDTVYGYTKIVTPLFEKIILSKRQIQTLQKLRDTLLPKLISGEVKVRI